MNPSLRRLLQLVGLLCFGRVLGLMLAEYVWYFPPNFRESSFLTGRESTFSGIYAACFYVHILCSPVVLVLATLLRLLPQAKWHAPVGRTVAGLVLLGVVPSGFVMARGTLFGPIAQYAFQAHALATLGCCVLAIYAVRTGKGPLHQRWATRLLVMLYAPLLFRLVTGLAIVLNLESPELYALNAWGCWLAPWCALECYWLASRTSPTQSLLQNTQVPSIHRTIDSHRRGLTLVELLVLIAILGILLGLILPATRGTREASRRLQCQNNMRTLIRAVHNYHEKHRVFPSAMAGTGNFTQDEGVHNSDNAGRLSGWIAALPMLEQKDLYEQISKPVDFQGVSYAAFGPAPWMSSYPPWCNQLPLLLCPSDTLPQADSQPSLAVSNYAFCVGDQARNLHQPAQVRGAFACGMYVGSQDFSDGLSTTIAISELVREPKRARIATQVAGLLEGPSRCLEVWETEAGSYASVTRGSRWADGAAGPSLIHCILPPNGPSCAVDTVVGEGIYSAASMHWGGVNVAMADGSFEFIVNEIDTGQLDAPVPLSPSSPNSPSARVDTADCPYGVWGSLGNIKSSR